MREARNARWAFLEGRFFLTVLTVLTFFFLFPFLGPYLASNRPIISIQVFWLGNGAVCMRPNGAANGAGNKATRRLITARPGYALGSNCRIFWGHPFQRTLTSWRRRCNTFSTRNSASSGTSTFCTSCS